MSETRMRDAKLLTAEIERCLGNGNVIRALATARSLCVVLFPLVVAKCAATKLKVSV